MKDIVKCIPCHFKRGRCTLIMSTNKTSAVLVRGNWPDVNPAQFLLARRTCPFPSYQDQLILLVLLGFMDPYPGTWVMSLLFASSFHTRPHWNCVVVRSLKFNKLNQARWLINYFTFLSKSSINQPKPDGLSIIAQYCPTSCEYNVSPLWVVLLSPYVFLYSCTSWRRNKGPRGIKKVKYFWFLFNNHHLISFIFDIYIDVGGYDSWKGRWIQYNYHRASQALLIATNSYIALWLLKWNIG